MWNTLCNYVIQREIAFVDWVVHWFKKQPKQSEATTRIQDALAYQRRQQNRRNRPLHQLHEKYNPSYYDRPLSFTPPIPVPPANVPPRDTMVEDMVISYVIDKSTESLFSAPEPEKEVFSSGGGGDYGGSGASGSWDSGSSDSPSLSSSDSSCSSYSSND